MDNLSITLTGLVLFIAILLAAEVLAKIFDWK
jgi:hypothetical protein